MFLLVIAAGIIVGLLGFNLYRRLDTDRLDRFLDNRRKISRIVSRAEYVDGNRHLAVAIALSSGTFFYENADMQASIDLRWVDEIEYDSSLVTGTTIAAGRVLRLRSHSQSFEFVLPADVTSRWHVFLPPRRRVGGATFEPTLDPLAAK